MPLPVDPNVPVISHRTTTVPSSRQVSGVSIPSVRGTPSRQVSGGSVAAPMMGRQPSVQGSVPPVSRNFVTPNPPSVRGSVPPTERTLVGGSPRGMNAQGSREGTPNATDILTQTRAMSLDAPAQSGKFEAEEVEAMDESPTAGRMTRASGGGASRKSTARPKGVPSVGSELQAVPCGACMERGSACWRKPGVVCDCCAVAKSRCSFLTRK